MPPERWLELTVRTSAEAELVSPVLFELGGTAVEEVDGALVTYLPPPPDLELFLEGARHRFRDLLPSGELDLRWRWQPQKEWEVLWRRGLGPRRITSRLMVVPSWEDVEPEPGEVVLTLDPGMAFGTAEHATTRGCLRLMDSRVEAGMSVADVGAGSGILSIAAARLGAGRVLALEVDAMACETATENVARNGVQDQVTVLEARVQGGTPLPRSPYDGIVANLQSHLLPPLLSSFMSSLQPEGWLILSGILFEEKDEILSSSSSEGLTFVEEDEEDGWWTAAFAHSGELG